MLQVISFSFLIPSEHMYVCSTQTFNLHMYKYSYFYFLFLIPSEHTMYIICSTQKCMYECLHTHVLSFFFFQYPLNVYMSNHTCS